MIEKRNYIQGDTETITDQNIGSFTLNAESNISLDGYFKFLVSDVVIKLASTSAVLTLDTDYELIQDVAYTNKEAESGGTGKTVYSGIKVINGAYASVDLLFTGSNFGTYTDNEAIWTLAGEEKQTAVDISSANGSIDLTQFESGGANELPAGSIVSGSWYDGDATYYCKWVSAGKFYNMFIPTGLAPGDGSSTFAWCGYGNGGLRLRLRENLTDWDVLTEGCFDKGEDGSTTNQRWKIYVDNSQTIRITNDFNTINNDYPQTFIIPFGELTNRFPHISINYQVSDSATKFIRIAFGTLSNTGFTISNPETGYGSDVLWKAEGRSRD